MNASPPRVLIIAGSDSSGGAGIQADIKTITMLGGYAMTAITAVTAQNTLGVQAVEVLGPELVAAQIDSCLSDIGVDAVKIGMLGSAQIAHAIADRLAGLQTPVVFDPVMVATSGAALADTATIAAFERLMRLAAVVTPNLPELAALTGARPHSEEAVLAAAPNLADRFNCAVLAKGGHGLAEEISDLLFALDGTVTNFTNPRIQTRQTHGTGCTLASALATGLANGQPLQEATGRAIRFVREAIRQAPGFGSGAGPLGHQAVHRRGTGE